MARQSSSLSSTTPMYHPIVCQAVLKFASSVGYGEKACMDLFVALFQKQSDVAQSHALMHMDG